MNYAQLNEQGFCIGESSLSGKVELDNMIEIDICNGSYLGRKYDTVNSIWKDEYLPIDPKPQVPTQLDVLQEELAQTKSIAANTDVTTSITAEDALLLMENQLAIDEKLDLIISHLGL